MHNITLIGMPGSGKTTLGKTLAEGLSYHFIDTDDVIIETYGQPLMELIDKHGTEGSSHWRERSCNPSTPTVQ